MKNRLAILILIILGAILSLPLIISLNSFFGSPRDNLLFVWHIWWFKYAVLDIGTNPFYTNYLFYPEGTSLFFSTSIPFYCVIYILFSAILTLKQFYNLLTFAIIITAAYTFYMLLRRMDFGTTASLAGAVIFAYNPFRMTITSWGAINIVSIQFIPLIIYMLIRSANESKKTGIIFSSILIAINFYIDLYIYLFSLFILFGIIIFYDENIGCTYKSLRKKIIIAVFIGTLLCQPYMIFMLHDAFASRYFSPGGHDQFAADLGYLFIPGPSHLLNKLIGLTITGYGIQVSYIGALSLFAGLWSFIRFSFKMKHFAIALFFVSIILSLGSYLHVFGNSFKWAKLPFYIIENIPVLKNIRAPDRFLLFANMGLAFGVAAFFDKLWNSFTKKYSNDRLAIIITCILIFLICIDSMLIPFPTTKPDIPNFYKMIKSDLDGYAILNIPIVSSEGNRYYLFYQTIHEKRLSGGILARFSPEKYARLSKLDINRDNLKMHNIKYLILHEKFCKPGDFLVLKNTYDHRLTKIAEENGQVLYSCY